jgi:hypothetical protein
VCAHAILKEKTMKKRSLLGIGVCLIGVHGAVASLPDDRVVSYLIREDPNDQESDVIFEIEFEIAAIQTNGNAIEWSVDQANFVEYDTNGSPIDSWTDDDPTVITSNGLWWVVHEDPESPAVAEFNMPPTVTGVATVDTTGDDLEYIIESGTLTQNQSEMYGGEVAGLTHFLARVAVSEPIAEGEDEPVEVDDPRSPPVG